MTRLVELLLAVPAILLTILIVIVLQGIGAWLVLLPLVAAWKLLRGAVMYPVEWRRKMEEERRLYFP